MVTLNLPLSLIERRRMKLFYKDYLESPDGIYMKRYHLLASKYLSIRIHHIVQSDYEKFAYHDHPWGFISILLKGWYIERMPGYSKLTRISPSIAFRAASALHTIVGVSDGGAWTLIICGRRKKMWGFVYRENWIPFTQFSSLFEVKSDDCS